MIKNKIWSFVLILGLLPIWGACSSDDDDNNTTELTNDQIAELLTGKWEVYGELNCFTNDINDISFTGKYKGIIEFKEDKKIDFKITDGDKYEIEYDGNKISYYLEESFVRNSYKYTLLKKNGRSYIALGSINTSNASDSFYFEIVTLKANKLKFVLDQDIIIDNKVVGHVYMTIVS